MSFIADKQTTDDLNLLGKYTPGSVYDTFNKVKTRGGERLLEEMFRHPLSDPGAINDRSWVFSYLTTRPVHLPVTGEQLGVIEDYLASDGAGHLLATVTNVLRWRLMAVVVKDESYGIICENVRATCEVLAICRSFFQHYETPNAPALLQEKVTTARRILADPRLALQPADVGDLPWLKLARLHHLLLHVLRSPLLQLCSILHELDVYFAVGRVAAERHFSFAHALPEGEYVLHAQDMRHPCLERGVGNPVEMNRHRNILFLTGANMAGKSTFMKAFGINLYLAHMGFPVAAKDMVFSVKEGIYSSINVSDSIGQGYSHFYAEVRRVKTVAEAVAGSGSLLVIFDELFKGTNVKDAYDATLAVTAAFARYRNCWFIISTHIIEVGEALRERYDNLQFVYLPTEMQGGSPRYTYRLTEGITSDRHGMIIIEQEGILDIINGQS